MNLTGRTAVVTGAAVRLGRAIALDLGSRGANVVVHHHSHHAAAEDVVEAIRSGGGRAVAVRADLGDAIDAAGTIFDATERTFGRADLLVNNAGIFEPGEFGSVSEDHWDRHLGLNLKAPFFLAQRFTEPFTAGKNGGGEAGAIVNILCRRATRPTADDLPYTAAKAGLLALTKGLALKLAPTIRVNGVAPGAMLPPAGRDEDRAAWEARKIPEIPLRRVGGAQPVVDAVRYLSEADFVTGEVLHVTGGEQL